MRDLETGWALSHGRAVEVAGPGREAGDVSKALPRIVDGPPECFAKKLWYLYGEPSGEFLQCRDGVTHFVIEGRGPRLAVVAHGLTDNLRSFAEVSSALVDAGFKVVRYDLYGHGWSHMRQGLVVDLDTLLLQLRQLLDHLLAPGQALDLFVGHSTGAVVGAAAASKLPELDHRRVDRLGLISPAFWKTIPDGLTGLAIAASEQVPSLTRSFVVLKVWLWLLSDMIRDGFAHDLDEVTGQKKWLYPTECENHLLRVTEALEQHPHLFEASRGLITTVLREDVMKETRQMLKSLVAASGPDEVAIGLFWGTHDVIVDFRHSGEVTSWLGGDVVTLVPVEGLGHSSPSEDGGRVGAEIVRWLEEMRATMGQSTPPEHEVVLEL